MPISWDKSSLYRRYVVLIMLLIYMMAYVDRQIVVILGEAIKKDLNLTDAELGAVSGFAFAMFYLVLGLPIAHLADRKSRVVIVSAAVAIWSGMTAACGFAHTFLQLALARAGVVIGEAGCAPPAHSLISDYFPRESRATALGFFALGAPLGLLIGFLFGGALAETTGWRGAFKIFAIPGLILGLITLLTVREPVRGAAEGTRHATPDVADRHALKTLWHNKIYVGVCAAMAFHVFGLYATVNWYPILLMRNFEMGPREAGRALALLLGAGAAVGTYLGGTLCDAFAKKVPSIYVLAPGLVCVVTPALIIKAVFASSATESLAWFALPGFLLTFMAGPVLHMIQTFVPPDLRAFASAVALLSQNLIGLGFGPLLVGATSDILRPTHGSEALPMAIALGVSAYWIAAALYFRCIPQLRQRAEEN